MKKKHASAKERISNTQFESKISIKEIDMNDTEFVYRKIIDPLKYEAIKQDVKKNSVHTPVKLRARQGKKLQIVAGWTRINVAMDLGLNKIPAYIYSDITDSQARYLSLSDNLHRSDLNPVDLAPQMEALRKNEKMSVPEIARFFGVNTKAVYQHLAINKMSPLIINALRLNKISLNQATELHSIPVEDQNQILYQALEEEWSVRRIKKYKQMLNHPYRKTVPDPRLKEGLFHALRYERYSETENFRRIQWETMHREKRPGLHKCEVSTTTAALNQTPNYVCNNDIEWAVLQPWPVDTDLQSRVVWAYLCDECTDIMFPGIIKHPDIPCTILLKNMGYESKYFGNVSKNGSPDEGTLLNRDNTRGRYISDQVKES